MNGLQFFFYEDVPFIPGFALYIDTPFALTSVSQKQFWPNINFSDYGNGKEGGVLSAIISNFTTPGILYNKTALECTPQELIEEIYMQIKTSSNAHGKIIFQDSNIAGNCLDFALQYENGKWTNEEPLFISSVGSRKIRPNAYTEIPNLFIAADWVLTDTCVTPTSMEATNEVGAFSRVGNEIRLREEL
jgi:15-cis-phytoene desaturase